MSADSPRYHVELFGDDGPQFGWMLCSGERGTGWVWSKYLFPTIDAAFETRLSLPME